MPIRAFTQEIEIGIQGVVRGDSLDIQEIVDLAVQFFQMAIPILIMVIAIRNTFLDYRYSFRVARCKRAAYREAKYQPVSLNRLLVFSRVSPVLMFVFVRAFIFGLNPFSSV